MSQSSNATNAASTPQSIPIATTSNYTTYKSTRALIMLSAAFGAVCTLFTACRYHWKKVLLSLSRQWTGPNEENILPDAPTPTVPNFDFDYALVRDRPELKSCQEPAQQSMSAYRAKTSKERLLRGRNLQRNWDLSGIEPLNTDKGIIY